MAMAEAKRIAPSREGSPQLRLSIRTAYARRLDPIVGEAHQRLIRPVCGFQNNVS